MLFEVLDDKAMPCLIRTNKTVVLKVHGSGSSLSQMPIIHTIRVQISSVAFLITI